MMAVRKFEEHLSVLGRYLCNVMRLCHPKGVKVIGIGAFVRLGPMGYRDEEKAYGKNGTNGPRGITAPHRESPYFLLLVHEHQRVVKST
jgi:hypothetical protein